VKGGDRKGFGGWSETTERGEVNRRH
jgi:hypothetical protein